MKNILLLIILLCASVNIWAKKVPGYMGLRCYVQYQGGISPQWNNLSASPLPYYSHNVQLGYVVSRKYEIGLQYTRIDYSSGVNKFATLENYDNSGYGGESSLAINYRKFSGNNVMAYIKFFRERKGFIAPLGRYYLLGLSYEYSKDRLLSNLSNDYANTSNYVDVKSHDIAATLGIGRNIILVNRLLITIEGDVNIPLTAGIRAALNSSADTYDASNPIGISHPNFYKKIEAGDLMLMNLLQIKIGFGTLLF